MFTNKFVYSTVTNVSYKVPPRLPTSHSEGKRKQSKQSQFNTGFTGFDILFITQYTI